MRHKQLRNGSINVAIIGAGLGGIGLAVRLKKAGIDDFTVFERSSGPGGVWHANRYPGAAVDIPSALYTYSFKKTMAWEREHATGPELLEYIDEVIDENDIRGHFEFDTAVMALRWDEWDQHWDVELASGETRAFKIVVPAVGMLSIPNYPTLPGMADFEGEMFHTARWEDHDLSDKTVAYIGAGSTAGQAVPAVAQGAKSLLVFQREPGWVLPKQDEEITPAHRARVRAQPWLLWRRRWEVFRQFESMGSVTEIGSPEARQFEQLALGALEVVEDPEVRAALTPSYPIMCKRPVMADSSYFEAFNRPNVELVPKAVEGFTADGIVTADGVERKVDAVILSTGFQATNYLATIEVTGRNGERLEDVWEQAGGPFAFLGLAVPRFPNLFMIYGPNSNVLTSIIFVGECQARFITRVIRRMLRRGWGTVQVRAGIAQAFRSWVDNGLADHPSAVGGCNNYFVNANGKIVTLFPGNAKLFWALTRFSDRLAISGRPSVGRAETVLQSDEIPDVEVPNAA